ncbi:alkaline phosphatase family protein, partial [Halobium palmae]
MSAERTFVLGLDGVPWYLLERYVEDGELPNFQRLMEEGSSGPLRSTVPATTSLAWPSIATGTWADQHGSYYFQRVTRDHRIRMNTSADIRVPTLWDVIPSSVVGNVPMTYPAREIDGTMVTGMLTPDLDADGSTWPPEYKEEINREIPEYRIALQWPSYTDDKGAFLGDFEAMVNARQRLMNKLLDAEEWRLFFFVFTAPDRLQHLFWEDDVLLDHYRHLDEILGELLDRLDRMDANLFVVSDHGFGPISWSFHPNVLLERHGFLARKGDTGSRQLLGRIGLEKSHVERVIDRISGGRQKALLARLPDRLIDAVADSVPGNSAIYDVDFTRTRAFVHGEGNVYVNDSERFDGGVVDPEDRAEIKSMLRRLFEGWEDPNTGLRPVVVHDGDDLFPQDDDSPDLVIACEGEYEPKVLLHDDVVAPAGAKAASHRPIGVLLAWG